MNFAGFDYPKYFVCSGKLTIKDPVTPFYIAKCGLQVRPILPEPRDRAELWRETVVTDYPFPLLADGEKRIAEQYDQPTRFGPIGKLHDLLGRLPQSLVLDTRGKDPTVIFPHRGDSIDDRPAPEELITTVEDIQESFVFDCSLVEC